MSSLLHVCFHTKLYFTLFINKFLFVHLFHLDFIPVCLVSLTSRSSHEHDPIASTEMIAVDDYTFGFNIGITISGSVLFRLVVSDSSSSSGRGAILFRVGLHTGFIPPGAFRVEQGSMDRPRSAADLGPPIIAADFVFSADGDSAAALDVPMATADATTATGAVRSHEPPPPDFEVMPSFAEGLAALSASHYEEVRPPST